MTDYVVQSDSPWMPIKRAEKNMHRATSLNLADRNMKIFDFVEMKNCTSLQVVAQGDSAHFMYKSITVLNYILHKS